MRKFFLAMTVCLLMGFPHLFAVTTFSGFSEMYYAARVEDGTRHIVGGDDDYPEYGKVTFPMDLGIHFDGQFDIADFIFVRTSLSGLAANAMRDSINGIKISNAKNNNNPDATENTVVLSKNLVLASDYFAFSVNEISLSLHFPVLSTMHYLSLFAGNTFESPGTDSYLGKYFGTSPISSPVIQTRLAHNGVPIFPTPGYGFAYHVKFPFPLMASVSGTIPTDAKSFSFDVRAAGAYPRFNFDAFAGADVVTAGFTAFRVGFSGFYGFQSDNFDWGLFLQAGMKFTPRGDAATFLGDLYAVVEPRFDFGLLKLNATFFSLPADTDTYTYDHIIFVNFANRPYVTGVANVKGGAGALGLALTVFKDDLYVGSLGSKVAFTLTGGLDNNFFPFANTVAAYNWMDHFHLQITPSWALTMKNGTLSILATFDPLNKYIHDPGGQAYTQDPLSTLGLRIGYIVNF